MPGYLDTYGAGEEQRNRIIIRSVVSVVVLVIVVLLGWYLFKNHHQESVVKAFLGDVKRGDLAGAYRDWGCTAQSLVPGTSSTNSMQDWGSAAKDGAPDPAILGITDSESCNTGVLLTVAVNSARRRNYGWRRASDAISFAPYPICPHKSPFAIMLHRTIGKLRKPLL